MKEPVDLKSMQAIIQLFEKLTAEIPIEEEEFPIIHQQFDLLGKH